MVLGDFAVVVWVLVGKGLGRFVGVLSERSGFLALFNVVFFGSVFVAALLSAGPYLPSEGGSVEGNLLVTFVSVFVFNLVVSGGLMLTVTGLVFFAMPVGVLVWRAVLWGVLLNGLSTPAFLAALPTVVLEGEGYVLAGVAGVVLGLSWLKPGWLGWGGVSRLEALKRALRECGWLYVGVVLLLLTAAAVETLTIYSG